MDKHNYTEPYKRINRKRRRLITEIIEINIILIACALVLILMCALI